MADIILRFNVEGVDPALVDPLDVADELFKHYDAAGYQNQEFDLASGSLEAEWA